LSSLIEILYVKLYKDEKEKFYNEIGKTFLICNKIPDEYLNNISEFNALYTENKVDVIVQNQVCQITYFMGDLCFPLTRTGFKFK
jgi:hypothetical protein